MGSGCRGTRNTHTARAHDQVFDIAFFVLIPVVMLAIVSGIIIDAFGASRDRRNDVKEDQVRAVCHTPPRCSHRW